MTTILFRYLLRRVSFWIATALVTLLAFFFFFALLERIGDEDSPTILLAAWDVTLQLPRLVQQLLPACCAIGTAVALARLESGRELVLMRLHGVRPLRLAGWLAGISLLWVSAYATTTELALGASAAAERAKAIRRAGSYLDAGNDLWLRQASGYARIERISPSGQLLTGVTVLQAQDGRLVSVMSAEKAAYADGSWILRNVTAIERAAGSWSGASHAARKWDSTLKPAVAASFNLPPDSLSLRQLASNIRQKEAIGQASQVFERVRANRLADFAAIPLLTLAALWTARFAARPRPDAIKLAAGLVVFGAVAYYLIAILVRQLAVESAWPAAAGAWLPAAAVGTIAAARLLVR